MFTTRSPEETIKIGYGYGERAKAGDIYCLSGELGAGKTVFAKGFARGLCVPEETEIVSPTFVLANEYNGRLPFYHFDVYRLGPEDMYEIGFDDYISGDGVVLIEWAERIFGLLPPDCIWLTIAKDPSDENIRYIYSENKKFP